MPGEATETVPVTEQELQQPQVETGSYELLINLHVPMSHSSRGRGGVLVIKKSFGRPKNAQKVFHDGSLSLGNDGSVWI